MATLLGVSLVLLAQNSARADTESGGNGPGGDGSVGDGRLHLIPEVITNSGLSVSGSSDFPLRAGLFLPELSERAKALATSRASVEHAVRTVAFDARPNPLFSKSYAETRRALFASPAPQRPSLDSAEGTARGGDGMWLLLMSIAAAPAIGLAILLGRKNATRRMRRDAGSTH
ncbi:hypothetical protein [Leifsonia shinshuensis]|uniref:hypothetical protein n=1 Tax=Leifsonia shinshuensis TaxID=150026 RepID=UPI002856EDE0|nr:hypothetical protein [Leifsonia shinshuensis]MDR6971808.1 hypothetical protein [Leifsonia shinshuensis]